MPPLESIIQTLATAADPASGESLLETIQKGGPIGYLIIGLSVCAVVVIFVHFMQIRHKALLPPDQIEQIDHLLARGDVNGALSYTADPSNDSYLTRILNAGLVRYTKSAFGAFEIKSAIEESGEEQTARLYRSTDALQVIASIAPLMGLLGTVVGMVGAFSTLSKSAAIQPEKLADNISLALVTTVMGLILAIPCMALVTYFRNRIDAYAAEAGREIERMILHLESLSSGSSGPPPAAARPAGPTSQPQRPVRPQPPAQPSARS